MSEALARHDVLRAGLEQRVGRPLGLVGVEAAGEALALERRAATTASKVPSATSTVTGVSTVTGLPRLTLAEITAADVAGSLLLVTARVGVVVGRLVPRAGALVVVGRVVPAAPGEPEAQRRDRDSDHGSGGNESPVRT